MGRITMGPEGSASPRGMPLDAIRAPRLTSREVTPSPSPEATSSIVEPPRAITEKIVYIDRVVEKVVVERVEIPIDREVVREVYVDVPKEVIKTITVIKEVPVHVEKYTDRDVYVDRVVLKEVISKRAKVAIAALTLTTLLMTAANIVGALNG